MERNTLTTAKELKVGDRFYLAADKRKQKHQMVEHAPRKTKYSTYLFWYCPDIHVGKKDESRNTQPIKENTKVVFLRSAIPDEPRRDTDH